MPSTPLPDTTAAPQGAVLDPQCLSQHIDAMRRVARALCASESAADADADDLVQDTLERVLRRPREIKGDPGPYLSQAVRFAFLDRRRARRSRVRLVRGAEGALAEDAGATAGPHVHAEANELLGAVRRLPDRHRQAVVALDILGFSASEASTAIGVPPGTLESRAFRGRARLASMLAA